MAEPLRCVLPESIVTGWDFSTGAVPEQRINFQVIGIDDTGVAVAADDQGQVAGAREDVSGAGNQGVDEA